MNLKPILSLHSDGWLAGARRVASPNYDQRPKAVDISMIVIHNISLPPGQYGGEGILALFTNQLDKDSHPYYQGIANLRVSSHLLIRRDGELIQCVSLLDRAWHAGASIWQTREKCNDFSIGIELEGCDTDAFTEAQYLMLNQLIATLEVHFPIQHVLGHSDIAPGRKTDPGPMFDWTKLNTLAETPLRSR